MLSIVIPTLNEEKYLPLILESIKKQNRNDYEIIVADADSKDKTAEIARSYGCKVVKGGLPPKGRNEGAKIAKGDLFLFLDADLVLPENFLDKLLDEFRGKKLDVVSTDMDFLGNKKIYKIFAAFCNFIYKNTQKVLPCVAMCILVKKDFHQKIGGFDEKIKLLEDFVYVRKIAKIGKFGHLNSLKFYTSPRRFEVDGGLKTALKYLLANVYMAIFGPIESDLFSYKFGHYLKKPKD